MASMGGYYGSIPRNTVVHLYLSLQEQEHYNSSLNIVNICPTYNNCVRLMVVDRKNRTQVDGPSCNIACFVSLFYSTCTISGQFGVAVLMS